MASLFLLAPLSSLAFLCCSNADFVADICSESKLISPATCAQILRSDPRSRGSYPDTLGQIAIKKAIVAVKDTTTVAKSMLDLNNTSVVSVCMRVCDSAIDDLNTVSEKLKDSNRSNRGDVPITLSAAATYVVTCDETFTEIRSGEPAEVAEVSRIARDLILVVLTIVGMFP